MARQKPSETPLMRQYLELKEAHPDAILFFRLGDFYEMFFEDAMVAAEKLELTLTSRDKGREDGVPMCGVPHHAARGYIARLTDLGFKVALCEQMEDPRKARGLVKRDVVRVITPGIVLDDEVLDPKTPRYLAAVNAAGGRYGLALLDVSTGEFRAAELESAEALAAELARAQPRELLAADAACARLYSGAAYCAFARDGAGPDADPAVVLESALGQGLTGLGLSELPLATAAAADAVAYARATQPGGTLPLSRLQVYRPGDAVVLDEAAVANLELCATLVGGKKAGSLLGVIDRTRTAPGGRWLRRWMLYPLTEVAPIRRRQDAVEYLVEQAALRSDLRRALAAIADLERLAGRVSLGVATPRDLGLIRNSLERLPEVAGMLANGAFELPELLRFDSAEDRAMLVELAQVAGELALALVDDPPAQAREGGFIREGFCEVVDAQSRLARGGREEILAIEQRERERSGIPSLKVKYNKVFGYYIEITRAHLGRVPDDYARKQTIANGERYVTTELAELEGRILAAQENLLSREAELFERLCRLTAERTALLVRAGERVATIDCCAALAEVAHECAYVRPVVEVGEHLDIVDGRHPVVEQAVSADGGGFVPNDCQLEAGSRQILLITGPNMAGKSTYMRQVAQIVILAQMGSFVPASRARVGLCDRVFTRVGATDNLARGESTFMVEMRETAAILSGATRRSLVVLDEVGRGTSTYDGVSIAWAVTEFLHDAIGARTLFATHYHELCGLAETRPRIRNVSAAVRERQGKVVFLRRVVEGGASRSYGIDVARLAGLPPSVTARARQILGQLEGQRAFGGGNQLDLFMARAAAPTDPRAGDGLVGDPRPGAEPALGEPSGPSHASLQGPRSGQREALEQLEALDPNTMTPIAALAELARLRDLAIRG